jgi:hypothetical protein
MASINALTSDSMHESDFAIRSSGDPVAHHEPNNDRDHRQQEQYVNEPAGDMERGEAENPQRKEHDCDYPQEIHCLILVASSAVIDLRIRLVAARSAPRVSLLVEQWEQDAYHPILNVHHSGDPSRMVCREMHCVRTISREAFYATTSGQACANLGKGRVSARGVWPASSGEAR